MIPITPFALERFWAKVNKTDYCWEWTGGKYPFGYGCFKFHNQKTGAHRFSWSIDNGVIPKGFSVLHKCDNPGCVNPVHLFLGTQQDNMTDRRNKWRHVYGETHTASKLTEQQVKDIWFNLKRESPSVLAEKHHVSRRCIRAIYEGKNWKWLTDILPLRKHD